MAELRARLPSPGRHHIGKRLAFDIATIVLVVAAMASSALAGNGAPSGSHYNLNLIGKAGTIGDDLTNGDRHTIFVKLNGQTRIWLCESGVDPACAGVDGF